MTVEAKDIVACHKAVDAMELRLDRCFGRMPASIGWACDGEDDGARKFARATSEMVNEGKDCQELKARYASAMEALK